MIRIRPDHSRRSLVSPPRNRCPKPFRSASRAILREAEQPFLGASPRRIPDEGSQGGTHPRPAVTYHCWALAHIRAFRHWVVLGAWLLGFVSSVPSDAQIATAPGDYVGASVCGSCHPDEFDRQSRSGHARTLHRVSDHPLRDQLVPSQPLRRPPGFRFRYRRAGEQIEVQADDNEYVMELPLDWAFGAGDHGVTFVSRLNSQSYLEHAFSYYSEAGSLDLTTGHETIRPETLLQAMGLRYSVRGPGNAISNCFACHSTGPLSYSSRQEVEIHEPGVRCESCHGPGSSHVDAVSKGDIAAGRSAIRNPTRLAVDDQLQFCGTCHRDPDSSSDAFDFDLAWNVRHQPPYFRKSSCFLGSGENLSCFTCHDPHEAVRRNQPDYYRERCMTCHGEEGRRPADTCEGNRPSDCTGCHMPTVAASSNLKFKNHWIGIYREGESQRPVR